MRFENFEIANPPIATVLLSQGHEWDLHAWVTCTSLVWNVLERKLVLEWRVPGTDVTNNPWSSPGNLSLGCQLVFLDVTQLHVRLNPGTSEREDWGSLEFFGRVVPFGTDPVAADEGEVRAMMPIGDSWNLLLDFVDDWSCEVGADRALLIPLHS